jgi:HEAT repeat protein
MAVADLDDAALIAAIPDASMTVCCVLMEEAGRRRLIAAVPALAAVCRRLKGFGDGQVMREQIVALESLAAIGGAAAARAVAAAIVRSEVCGPNLTAAVAVAARLGAPLPAPAAIDLLRHDDPKVRADACRCVRAGGGVVEALLELRDDLNPGVRVAAICALGRLGRVEARPALTGLLVVAPTIEGLESLAAVADDEAIVLIGRVGCARSDLADAAAAALEGCEHPLAEPMARKIRATWRTI